MPDAKLFDWKDLAGVFAPIAPTLGGLIGGFIPFPGAAAAGQVLGGIIAKKFGVPAEPKAVADYARDNPNEVVLAKLRAATEEMKARYPAVAAIAQAHAEVDKAFFETVGVSLEQVNRTMRAQIGHEHWFFSGWRAACGWVFVIYSFLFGAILTAAGAAALRGDPAPLAALETAWPLYAGYFAALAAMVGVYVIGRSRERVEATRVSMDPIVPGEKPK